MKDFTDAMLDQALKATEKLGGGTEMVRQKLITLQHGLEKEKAKTKIMMEIYQRYLRGEASKLEMIKANRQLREVMKSVGLGVIIVLPFSPVTIPLLVKLGDKLNVDLFPESFKEENLDSEESIQEGIEEH